jgi:hypothetical protein
MPATRRSWEHIDDDTDGDLPPWAGLGVAPHWADSGQRQRPVGDLLDTEPPPPGGGRRAGGRTFTSGPGFRQRLGAARAKRARRTKLLWAVAVVAVIAAGVVFIPRLLPHHKQAALPGSLVTTFLPGELKTVPSACSAVPASVLSSYLPGHRHIVVPQSVNGRSESLCDWSVDTPPVYRLLEVTVQAFSPSGLASGSGSATFAAMDAYQQALLNKTKLAKGSHQAPAEVRRLTGLGTSAFSALQVPTAGGDTTDLVTVVTRDRNVLVTVVFDGLAHSQRGRYGPVSVPQLQAGAKAAARAVLAGLH